IAAVTVVDHPAGGQGPAPRVAAVEDLREGGRGVAGLQAGTTGDRRAAGRGRGAVVGLGVAGRRHVQGVLVDRAARGVERVAVVIAAVAVVDYAAGRECARP